MQQLWLLVWSLSLRNTVFELNATAFKCEHFNVYFIYSLGINFAVNLSSLSNEQDFLEVRRILL